MITEKVKKLRREYLEECIKEYLPCINVRDAADFIEKHFFKYDPYNLCSNIRELNFQFEDALYDDTLTNDFLDVVDNIMEYEE